MDNMDLEKTSEQGLKKQLNPMSVWALAFGCVIGWGSFINPGKKFLPNSGVAGTAIAMVLGALVMVIIAFSYAYLIPKYPKAGGEFTFTRQCYGKVPAYICGWFLAAAYLTNVPMNSTAIPLIIKGIFGDSALDLEAARRAGFRRVFARYGGGDPGKETADFEVGSFAEFVTAIRGF